MLEGLELVFNLIAKFEVVERLYLPSQTILHSRLTESIITLYVSILEFLVRAGLYFEQKSSLRIVKSIFQLEEITTKYITDIKNKANDVEGYVRLITGETINNTESRLGRIEGNLARLDLTLQTLNIADNRFERLSDSTDEEYRNLQKTWEELHEPITRIANHLSDMDDKLDRTDRIQVFDWLSQVPYTSHHRSKAKILLPGSGEWLLQKPEFSQWLNASTSSILWLHGIPGSGKSMLVARVIEYLKSRTSGSPDNTSLAFFYCTRNANEPERASPLEILRSVIEQLSCSAEDSPIRLPVVEAYLERKKEARGRRPEKLDLEDCIPIILELLQDNPATIILDGLDECDPTLRQQLLDALGVIIRMSGNVVKVFVSSRDDHDLVHRLSQTPNLYIQASDNMEDIRNFVVSGVNDAIYKDRILCGKVSDNLKEAIISTLISQSNGMFRLVSLHIDSLCNPDRIKTKANVLESLKTLPADLKDSYDAILERIQHSQAPNPVIAERTLKWLLCAREPLPSNSFLITIHSNFDKNNILHLSEILSICCNLVIYDSETDQFRFAHLSVREHLQALEAYSISASNALAAERCLSWLFTAGEMVGDKHITWGNMKNPACNYFPMSDIFGVWHHADTHWAEYAHLAGKFREQGQLKKLLEDFLLFKSPDFQRESLIFYEWVSRTSQDYWTRHSGSQLNSRFSEQDSVIMLYFKHMNSSYNYPMLVACTFDLPEIVSALLGVQPWGPECGQAAVAYGSNESLQILLSALGKQRSNVHLSKLVIQAAVLGNIEHQESIMAKMENGAFTSEYLYEVIRQVSLHRLPLEEASLELLFKNNPNLQITEEILKLAFESFNYWHERKTAQSTVQKLLRVPTLELRQVLQISSMIEKTIDNDLMSKERGEYYLHLLLKMNARLTEGAVRVLLERCHVEMVSLVLRYQSIEVEDSVIAAAARNVGDGQKIMEVLLEKELED